MKKILLMFGLGVMLFSCSKKHSTEEVVLNYITDSIYPNNKLINIDIRYNDSLYSSVYRHQSYINEESELYEYYTKATDKIKDYNSSPSYIQEMESIKGLILFYQKTVNKQMNKLNDLEKSFKSKYIGRHIGVQVKYETDFNDSISFIIFEIASTNDSIMNYYILPPELSNNEESIKHFRYSYLKNNLDIIDTTMFITFK